MENKYLAQAHKGKTSIWRYVIGIVLAMLGSVLFSVPYSFVMFNEIIDSNTVFFCMMLPSVGGMLALYLVISKLHKLPWTAFNTSRSKIDFKRVLFSFSLWGGVSVLVILSSLLINPDQMVWHFDASQFWILLVMAILMIPIQTSFEEYLFRGYLMQALGVSTGTKWLPLFVTSVVFGVVHFTNPEVQTLGYGMMVFYIGTGLLLGVMTLMDEGIELSLGFHAANNLITALLVTTDWTAFQTAALFKDFSEPSLIIELLLVATLYPLLLFVLAKKYKWSQWKSKLI